MHIIRGSPPHAYHPTSTVFPHMRGTYSRTTNGCPGLSSYLSCRFLQNAHEKAQVRSGATIWGRGARVVTNM